MSFKDIPNQDRVKRILTGAIANKRVANAYLFSSSDAVLANQVALTFAKALNCEKKDGDSCGECLSCRKAEKGIHPDIVVIASDGEYIKIDQIRELRSFTRHGPVEVEFKVIIIEEADKMRTEAANSFLKTLEEPLSQIVFILVTSKEDSIPKTIVSRCQRIIFGLFDMQHGKDEKFDGSFLERAMSIGNMDIVETLNLSSELLEESENIEKILNRLLLSYRERVIRANGKKDTDLSRIKTILKALRGIEKNANKRLALDNMFLKLKEI